MYYILIPNVIRDSDQITPLGMYTPLQKKIKNNNNNSKKSRVTSNSNPNQTTTATKK